MDLKKVASWLVDVTPNAGGCSSSSDEDDNEDSLSSTSIPRRPLLPRPSNSSGVAAQEKNTCMDVTPNAGRLHSSSSDEDDNEDSLSSTSIPRRPLLPRPSNSSGVAAPEKNTCTDITILQTSLEEIKLDEEEYARQQEQLEKEEEEFCARKRGYDAILERGDFASDGDKMDSIADTIRCDQYYGALIGNVSTPGEFYVNPARTWTALENMMAEIQKDYKYIQQINDEQDTTIGVPWKGHLVKGFILGAKFDGEYHRARILTMICEDKYMVKLIDYGDTIVASFGELRYLPRKFLAFKIQAIRCKVLFNNLKGDNPWTAKDGDVLRRMMKDVDCFLIHFKNEYQMDGETVWEVFIHIYDSRHGKITKFHLERDMILETGRTLCKKDEKIADTKEKVALADFKFAEGYLVKPAPVKRC